MSRALVLRLYVAAAALVGVLWLIRPPRRPPAPEPEPAAATPARAPTRKPPPPSERPSKPAPAAGAGWLLGVVLGPERAPVAGARVAAWSVDEAPEALPPGAAGRAPEWFREHFTLDEPDLARLRPIAAAKPPAGPPRVEATTGPDGAFRLAWDRPEAARLEVTSPDGARTTGRRVLPGVSFEALLTHGLKITVRVQDGAGAPLPGASVGLLEEEQGAFAEATADGRGMAVFTPLRIGVWRVAARSPGRASAEPLEVRLEADEELVLVLPPAPVASLRIVDAGGSSVPGAGLFFPTPEGDFDPLRSPRAASAGPDGRARATLDPAAGQTRLFVAAEGRGLAVLEEGDLAGEAEITVVLPSAAPFAARVVDEAGKAVAGASVQLLFEAEGGEVSVRLVSDAEGRVRFASLPAGIPLTLVASAPGRGTVEQEVSAGATPGDVVLPAK